MFSLLEMRMMGFLFWDNEDSSESCWCFMFFFVCIMFDSYRVR